MKNKWFFTGILSILLVFGLMMAGCDNDTTNTGGNSGGNPFTGTWNGIDGDGDSITLVVTDTGWSVSWSDYPGYGYSGTYTYNGNAATLYNNGGAIGSVTVSENSMTGTVDGIWFTANSSSGGKPGDSGGGITTKPSAPTGVYATAQSSSSISVSWNSVSGATSYKVYYEIGNSTTKNLADIVYGTSYTHTGLQASTTYYYYIVAVNSAGESAYSSYDYATTQSGGGSGTSIPSAPTGVYATAQSSSSISVSWNSVSGATSYKVYYEIGSSTTKNLAGTVSGTSYTHTGLQASTTYYYYIVAVNSAGESGYSSYDYATTQSGGGGSTTKPSAPTGVTASRTPRSNQYVTISWNAVSGATSYYIYSSTSASGTYQYSGYTTATSTERYYYNDTTSYWKVSAVNDAGESALSSTYGTALGWQP